MTGHSRQITLQSFIHTTELDGGNAFHYLTELMRQPKAVAESPGQWLPWNYRETLAPMAGGHPTEAQRPTPPLDRRVGSLGASARPAPSAPQPP